MNRAVKKISIEVLKFGSICLFLLMILFLVLFYGGRHPQMISPAFDIRLFLMPIFIFIIQKQYRDVRNGGVLHFWEALLATGMFTLFIAVTMVVFITVFGTIEKEYLERYINGTMELMESKREIFKVEKNGEATLDTQLEKLPHTTAFILAQHYFWFTLVIGLFWSIIISIVLRKQPKN